jgi:hypothetical protein
VTLLGKRSITDADERRLLELLAASADGCADALLTAKGGYRILNDRFDGGRRCRVS